MKDLMLVFKTPDHQAVVIFISPPVFKVEYSAIKIIPCMIEVRTDSQRLDNLS